MDTPGDSTKTSKTFTFIILSMALALNARETAAMQAVQAVEQTRQISEEDRQDRQDSEASNDDNAVTNDVNNVESVDTGAMTQITELPKNLRVPSNMRPTLLRMLQRSETFRRQIAVLTRKPAVRVSVAYGGLRGDRHYHALSTVRKHEWGAMVVDTMIFVPSDIIEIIAHELEHVCEQVEGVDLRMLSRRRGVGVYDLNGHFETTRAIRAGQEAAREYHDGPDYLQQSLQGIRATY